MLNRPILRLPNKPKKPVAHDISPTVDAVAPLDVIAATVQKPDVFDQPAIQKTYYPRNVRCPQYGGFARQRFTP